MTNEVWQVDARMERMCTSWLALVAIRWRETRSLFALVHQKRTSSCLTVFQYRYLLRYKMKLSGLVSFLAWSCFAMAHAAHLTKTELLKSYNFTDDATGATAFALLYGAPFLSFAQSFGGSQGLKAFQTNTIRSAGTLANAASKFIKAPNADTLYGLAVIDLAKQDLVVKLPPVDKDRYYLLAFYDPSVSLPLVTLTYAHKLLQIWRPVQLTWKRSRKPTWRLSAACLSPGSQAWRKSIHILRCCVQGLHNFANLPRPVLGSGSRS